MKTKLACMGILRYLSDALSPCVSVPRLSVYSTSVGSSCDGQGRSWYQARRLPPDSTRARADGSLSMAVTAQDETRALQAYQLRRLHRRARGDGQHWQLLDRSLVLS